MAYGGTMYDAYGNTKWVVDKLSEEDLMRPGDFSISPAQQSAPLPQSNIVKLGSMYNCSNSEKFHDIDEHARAVAAGNHRSLTDILWDLIYSVDIKSDICKARAIFTWVCSRNMPSLSLSGGKGANGEFQRTQPEYRLHQLCIGKGTYAQVYESMCHYVGMQCRAIGGYAKGHDYKPGDKISPDDPASEKNKHSWVIVRIEGTWHLCDPHWGARKQTMDPTQSGMDDYFFLPNPLQFIYTHMPNEQQYQLLPEQISMDDFCALPIVQSRFFKYGFLLCSHVDITLVVNRELVLKFRHRPALNISFTYNVYKEKKDQADYRRYVIMDRSEDAQGGILTFIIRPPPQGMYNLAVYGQDVKSDMNKPSGKHGGICEYIINAQPHMALPAFPPVQTLLWGTWKVEETNNIKLSIHNTIISTKDGTFNFSITRNDPKSTQRFYAKITSEQIRQQELTTQLLHRNNGLVDYFSVSFPAAGEYGVVVYMNSGKEGHSFKQLCQYFVSSTTKDPKPTQFPDLPHGFLGPQKGYEDLNLQLLKPLEPYMPVLDGSEIAIELGCHGEEGELRFAAELRQVGHAASTSARAEDKLHLTRTLLQFRDNKLRIAMRLPAPGFYKLHLFGVPKRKGVADLPCVYNFLIRCDKVSEVKQPYPKHFTDWQYSFLSSPLNGTIGGLGAGNSVNFRLQIPGTNEAVVLVGPDVYPLVSRKPQVWEGAIPLSRFSGRKDRVLVGMRLDDGVTVTSLLEYNIAS